MVSKDEKSQSRKLYNQAGLYRAQGNNEKAEALYLQSISLAEKELDKNYVQVAQSMYGLGVLYDLLDDNRSEDFYQKAVQVRGNAPAFFKTPGVYLELAQVACLRTSSSLLEQANEYAAAEWLVVKVGSIVEKLLSPDDPELSKTLFHLSTIYDKLGKQKESNDALQHASAIKERVAVKTAPQFNRKIYQKTQAVRALSQKVNRTDLATAIWLNHLATIFANSEADCVEMHLKTLADIREILDEQKKQK